MEVVAANLGGICSESPAPRKAERRGVCGDVVRMRRLSSLVAVVGDGKRSGEGWSLAVGAEASETDLLFDGVPINLSIPTARESDD
jgi:hypothetical protein